MRLVLNVMPELSEFCLLSGAPSLVAKTCLKIYLQRGAIVHLVAHALLQAVMLAD
jgi:hypothetical protein